MNDNPVTQNNSSQQLAAKVVPLLQSLSELEINATALVSRLDPIIQHIPIEDRDNPGRTVTERITQVSDILQYLLEHIEL